MMAKPTKPTVDDINAAATRAKRAATFNYSVINEEALQYLRSVMNDKNASTERRDKAADRLLMIVNKGKTTATKGLKSQRVDEAQAQIDGGGGKFTPAKPPTGHGLQ